jgi:crotonobetainyl-CoA:carnitine CoA-transferase CaiB-like acyl-CoA transferase
MSAAKRTMSGIRVLDLSIALTGPYAAALMADQGADVIKVERPGIGDIARWVGVSVNGMSALYLVCNRGKRSTFHCRASAAAGPIAIAAPTTPSSRRTAGSR